MSLPYAQNEASKKAMDVEFLDKRAVENIIRAAEHAYRIGFPLNNSFTINWQQMGLSPGRDITSAKTTFFHRCGDWLAHYGKPLCYVSVMESTLIVGQHMHASTHVPPELGAEFEDRCISWLPKGKISFLKNKGTVNREIHSQWIGNEVRQWKSLYRLDPEYYLWNLGKVISYLIKGADKETWDSYRVKEIYPGIRFNQGYQGVVKGKRYSVSETLGQANRERYSKNLVQRLSAAPGFENRNLIRPFILVSSSGRPGEPDRGA